MTSDPVNATVATLQRSLYGPRRARQEMVREVSDGLVDAVESYRDAGLAPSHARHKAVADFGDPGEIAAELQAELAARYGRRAAAWMALAFPGLMLLWDSVWALGDASPRPLSPTATLLATTVDVLSLTAAAGCLLALAGLLLGARRGVRPGSVTRGVGFLALGTFVSVGGGSVMLQFVDDAPVSHVYSTPHAQAVVATTVCVAVWVVVSAHRCLRLGRVPRSRPENASQ